MAALNDRRRCGPLREKTLEFHTVLAYKVRMTFYHPRWPLLYEDNHLLVVYKPAGLVVQRDHKGGANLLDLAKWWLKQRYAKPGNVYIGLVHRLDGPVAGIMVLARTSKAASRLSSQFRSGGVDKHYLAVVEAPPPESRAHLTHWLVRRGRLSQVVDKGHPASREARLRYEVISQRDRSCLLAIHLETGRRHQIRAQLANIGCPIRGDLRYGADRAMANGRIALLAHRVAFDHPTKDRRLEFTSPIPEGWPWPGDSHGANRPLWAIEAFYREGLVLPVGPVSAH